MQQDHQRAVVRPGSDGVQANSIAFEPEVVELGQRRHADYLTQTSQVPDIRARLARASLAF